MMKPLPDDDEQLVKFLQEYRPLPPRARANVEAQLMELVTREPPPLPRHPQPFFWLVSSAMAGSLLLAVGGYRWFIASPQVATNSYELEAFLVDSWSGAMGETTGVSPTTYAAESDWLLLAEPETRYVVSYP